MKRTFFPLTKRGHRAVFEVQVCGKIYSNLRLDRGDEFCQLKTCVIDPIVINVQGFDSSG